MYDVVASGLLKNLTHIRYEDDVVTRASPKLFSVVAYE
jgi:hypothetical protein